MSAESTGAALHLQLDRSSAVWERLTAGRDQAPGTTFAWPASARTDTLLHVIAVCGDLQAPESGAGAPIAIASRAAIAGATVEVVGVVQDDPDGDRRLIELASAGVGHAAVLRGPARSLEPADLDLALRYLPEIRVIVAVDLPSDPLATVAARAAWGGAALVVLARPGGAGSQPSAGLPDEAIVLEAPASDPDNTFAGFAGALAARLDAGETPADAWAATVRALAVDPA